MGCGCFGTSTPHSMETTRTLKQELVLKIPGCTVHLMDQGEAEELAKGDFTVFRILDENICLATIIKVGDDNEDGLQWPLTKDEPVVKLDSLHYLFSLPIKDGDPLSYGITFRDQCNNSLKSVDSFLKRNCCFSASNRKDVNNIDWKEYAPRIDNYNNFLAKAIAGGTGQIIKGIFICSNAYTNKIQKGGDMILTGGSAEDRKMSRESQSNGPRKKSAVNTNLTRARKLSKMTEKLSKKTLDAVGVATGSIMKPIINSQAGKAFLSMVPGEVLLASLDALNRIMDAAEVAEKQAMSATTDAATRAVSERYGERAGEATGEVLATAGHCANTAWNVFKIRKALNPASSVKTGVLKNAVDRRSTFKY